MQLQAPAVRTFLDTIGIKPTGARCSHAQFPLFQSVKLSTRDGSSGMVAFTRDISRSGIGLVHDRKLDVQLAKLHLTSLNVDVTVRIGLCQPCGNGWYTSYGSFEDVTGMAAGKLFISTAVRRFDPRSYFRHPFFCPVYLSPEPTACEELSVFARDISLSGIGLFHNQPLENRGVWINIPGREGFLWAKIQWCKPCGNGWYISGAQFDEQSMNELAHLA